MKYEIIEKGASVLDPIEFWVHNIHGNVEITDQSGSVIDQYVIRGENLKITAYQYYDLDTNSSATDITISDKITRDIIYQNTYLYCATFPGIILQCFEKVINIYRGDKTSVPTMPGFAIGEKTYGFSVPICEYEIDVEDNNEIVIIVYDIDLSIFKKIIFRDRDYFQNINFQGVPKWDIYGENDSGQVLISSGCNDLGHQAYFYYTKLCNHLGVIPVSPKQDREYRKQYNLK